MKKTLSKTDKILLVLTIIFLGFGLIMVLSASSMESYMRRGRSPYYYFIRQSIFVGIGCILFLIITKIPTRFYKRISSLLLLLITASLGALTVYGHVANSAVSWFRIGPLSIQPSEFAKVIIIIYLASYYDKKKEELDTQWVMMKPLIFILPAIFLVALQPDLGTAAIMTGITAFMFFSVPMKRSIRRKFDLIFVGAILIVVSIFIITGGSFLKSYQAQRILNFKDPCERYEEKTGYQVCNSFIAFANGKVTGQGIGKSTQKYLYLPESYTDFIFPIIVEEWGMIVGIIVIIFYLIVLYRLYVIARRATNLNNSLLAYGVCVYVFLHIAVNLIGVMGIGPLTGVPLPFLSYGGSYTISLLSSLALAQRVAIETNNETIKKERKKKHTKKVVVE